VGRKNTQQQQQQKYLFKKSNQAARKGTGPSKLATQESNKENAIHAQKNIQNRNLLSIYPPKMSKSYQTVCQNQLNHYNMPFINY